jgi:hypothetical protein
MADLTNCAACGKSFNEAYGTHTGEGLVCEDCADTDLELAADDATVPEGNVVLGFLAGFFGGCIGLIVVQIFAKGEKTKKGSTWGFIAQIAIGGALRAMSA